MKKILPILSIGAMSLLLTGCTNSMSTVDNDFKANITNFKQQIEDYSYINQSNEIVQTALNKYKLIVDTSDSDKNKPTTLDEPATLEYEEKDTPAYDISHLARTAETDSENEINETENTEIDDLEQLTEEVTESTEELDNGDAIEEEIKEEETDDGENTEETEETQFSTLYSLSNDIEESCDEFCELKEELTNAIIETENLIDKIQNSEVELTKEQRMFITEQSIQLKHLSRQLASATSELSFNLSDINTLIKSQSLNMDNLALKYLIVLDNLVNGNEMLQNGLSTITMMNNIMRMNNNSLPPNNRGRVLYGFQQNDEPPVVKDYYIDENGKMIENNQEEANNETTETVNTSTEERDTNVDTYKNTKLKSNIDTYGNFNNKNIDTFFNTALLDNEFMYGNGGYGYNGYGGAYPYLAQQNYQHMPNHQQTTNSDNTDTNTQNVEKEQKTQKKEKKFKLQKNVDTYRNENTPTLKTKFSSIKDSVAGFFGKFKKPDNVKNPVFREPLEETDEN